jgi:hypothetical protein
MVVGQSHYSVGKRYCRRCEYYFVTTNVFCECCGMHLRASPAAGEYTGKKSEPYKSIPGTELLDIPPSQFDSSI